MKSFFEYRNDSAPNILCEDVSDDTIWYRTGVLHLNWIMPDSAKRIISKFKISETNPRAGVVRYMKSDNPPLPKDSEEMFKRSTWDLDSLIGETEGQLMHDTYYNAANYIFKNHRKRHDILTIMQCSSKKPYSDNSINKANYYDPYGEYSDFACMSNPGIIPIEMSQYYPYRYDEWNIPAEEKLDEIIDMTKKYRIVNMCRLIRYKKEMGYKHIIVLINNRFKQWIFDEMYNKNIAGAKDWMHIVTSDSLRDAIHKKYPQLGGLQDTRTAGLPLTRDKYVRILKSLSSDSDAKSIEKIAKERRKLHESVINEDYTVKSEVQYKEFMKKFKDEIHDNISDPSIDKGSNNLYYKSYYWSVLDLLLLAMAGDLVEDIDGEYWKLMNELKADNDFEQIGDFLFAYKPLLKNDKVSISTCENEAYEMGILRKKPVIKLNPKLFK